MEIIITRVGPLGEKMKRLEDFFRPFKANQKNNRHHQPPLCHTGAYFRIQNKKSNENRWQPIFALAENPLHLTLALWGAWLARQQILQSVSHDCISIVQISLCIPPSSFREHKKVQAGMTCVETFDVMLTGHWQPAHYILHRISQILSQDQFNTWSFSCDSKPAWQPLKL